MEVDYFRLARTSYFVPVAVKIPGSDIELARHGNSESTRLDFIGQVKDAKGAIAGNVRDFIEVKLKDEAAQPIIQTPRCNTPRASRWLREPTPEVPGARQRNRQDGDVSKPKFTIPDLTSEPRFLPISSVVLSKPARETGRGCGHRRTGPEGC